MSNERNSRTTSIIKLILLIGIVASVPLYLIITKSDYIKSLGNIENMESIADFLKEYKWESAFIYIGLQIAQIIISVLPGQVFQMAAGYLYGFLPGLLLSFVGALLGSTIAYYLATFLGRDALKLFVKPETMDNLALKLNTKKAYLIVFLLYLIPGLPKDVIAYGAGASKMNIKAFLLMSMAGRLPAMSGSILMGALYESKEYHWFGIIAAISIIIFLICVLKRKEIGKYLDKFQ